LKIKGAKRIYSLQGAYPRRTKEKERKRKQKQKCKTGKTEMGVNGMAKLGNIGKPK